MKLSFLPPLNDATHLGDGVYVSFDGFQIWLATTRYDNGEHSLHRVALEPEVYQSLIRWIAQYPTLAHHMESFQ